MNESQMTMMKPVKLKDIAATLGISVSTVSRALSGKGRVNKQTMQQIKAIVEEVNYTPNDVARSLRMRDAKNIGIIVTDITNSFFSSVIKGAQVNSREKGYSILLSNSDENSQFEDESLQLMLEKQISGLILASVGINKSKIEQCQRLGVPVVFIDNMPEFVDSFDSVSADNCKASYELTNKLIAKGYREIGMVTGPLNQSSAWTRVEGFEKSLLEHEMSCPAEWLREGDFKIQGGMTCLEDILKLPRRPKAMILSNNYMAYGAISAIKKAGLSIPKDMAIVSFDVDDITSLMSPSITAMNQPAEEIGKQAIDILISRMTNPLEHDSIHLVLDPIFVEGNSW